jgi:hypothetical protein
MGQLAGEDAADHEIDDMRGNREVRVGSIASCRDDRFCEGFRMPAA